MDDTRRSRIFSGTILICLGIVLFLQTMGIIQSLNWSFLVNFWPLLLIFMGLNILLKRSRLWWLVPVLVIISFITLIIIGQPSFPGRDYHYHYEYNYEYDYESLYSNEEHSYLG
ncbi:MAG TPA: DUF5668 domain-containing protein [Halanaerobiales bacterium]|nr:DUF5668 domain-containing protein [Halanaerobiales bacterium]